MAKKPNETIGNLKAEVDALKAEIKQLKAKISIEHPVFLNTEEVLEFMSTHDYLTHLPNRAYFEKQLDKTLQHAREHDHLVALIYLNLDNFKLINDSLGHAMGDLLLKEVADLLLHNVRRGDIVARLGGDEFAVILAPIRKPEYADTVAHTILDKLGAIFNINGKEVYINASIGIAVYPFNGTVAAELLKNADIAMYVAKNHGKNQYRLFSEELEQQNEQNLQIINGLRHVIRNEELRLLYQPIIDLKNATCCGVEALLRWHHPQLGLLFPGQFILCAEAIGAIPAIGRWVLVQVLNDYNQYKLESLSFITINMSATEFIIDGVEDVILSSMHERSIPAEKLVVELTESTILSHPDVILKKFKSLTEVGVRIAIDDYGTGYSSLSLLKQLPIAIMKIDKCFIDDVGKDPHDTIIVQSTIKLAHSLGLKVIAEGVETKEQLEFLQANDCDYIQGFYFSQPLDIEQLMVYLEQPLKLHNTL